MSGRALSQAGGRERGAGRPETGQGGDATSPGRARHSPEGGHAMHVKRMGLALAAIGALVVAALVAVQGATPVKAANPVSGLHVSGNQLVDASGNNVVLWGVNRSGGEYACVP